VANAKKMMNKIYDMAEDLALEGLDEKTQTIIKAIIAAKKPPVPDQDPEEQEGSGPAFGGWTLDDLASTWRKVKSAVETAKSMAIKAHGVYVNPYSNIARNTWGEYANDNPNWRPGFPGEAHLLTERGVTYNW
jgi:hypothetical protein